MSIFKVKVNVEGFCNTCKEWQMQGTSDDPVDVFNSAYEHTENTGHMVTITGYTRQERVVSDLATTIATMTDAQLINLFEHGSLTLTTRLMIAEEIKKRAGVPHA